MRRGILVASIALLLCLSGCSRMPETEKPGATVSGTEPGVSSSVVTEPNVTEPAPPVTGWQELDGDRYYFKEDGIPYTGWLELESSRYYFREDGTVCTGWAEIGGVRRYFYPDGALGHGWLDFEGVRYYLDSDGSPVTGWLDLGESRYYLSADGSMHTGWLELEGSRYYFKEDGTMARGQVTVSDGQTRHFTSSGKEIILVNPWNTVPEDYQPELASFRSYRIAEECVEALERMLEDCKAAGHTAIIVSAYRTHEYQAGLYQRRVARFVAQGYSQKDAEVAAAMRVAVPGTSEHELGLALDIVDINYQNLTEKQETMPAQQWLMENCWQYGFILRYPNNKSEHTGIIYEPWHYRYVGKELALELRDSGLCLEEYLDQLTSE